jgi:hypothetical protein
MVLFGSWGAQKRNSFFCCLPALSLPGEQARDSGAEQRQGGGFWNWLSDIEGVRKRINSLTCAGSAGYGEVRKAIHQIQRQCRGCSFKVEA